MTDKLSDFFKDVKERISNPFFSSFIISWLVINWKIPIALIFYSQDDIKRDGYKSFFDLVDRIYNPWWFWVAPTVSALIYIFGFPYFRNFVLEYSAKMKTRNTDKILEITKEGKVSMDKYLKMRDSVITRTKSLDEVIAQESELLKRTDDLLKRTTESETKTKEYLQKITQWDETNNFDLFIRGTWNLFLINIPNNQFTYQVFQKDSQLNFMKSGNIVSTYMCIQLEYNLNMNTFSMLLKDVKTEYVIGLFLRGSDLNKKHYKGDLFWNIHFIQELGLNIPIEGIFRLEIPMQIEFSQERN